MRVGKSSRAGEKWRSRGDSVRNNLRQYELSEFFLDVLVADSSRSTVWRQQPLFDAIVTDRQSMLFEVPLVLIARLV